MYACTGLHTPSLLKQHSDESLRSILLSNTEAFNKVLGEMLSIAQGAESNQDPAFLESQRWVAALCTIAPPRERQLTSAFL